MTDHTFELPAPLQPGDTLTVTVAAASPQPPPPNHVVTGVVGDLNINGDNEVWQFDPGCIVKGKLTITAKNVTLRGFHTTSEQVHETAVIILPGSSGVLEDYLIEHIGTPSNGKGYSSIQAHDNNAGTGTSGPWTFRRGTQDQKGYGWYGTEVWGVKSLMVEDCTFKGKGGNNGAENGHMSIPRCDGAIIQRNTFDMAQGCYRVVEVVEEVDVHFIDNTVLELFGDVVPMNGGSSNKMARTVITGNRIKGKGTTPSGLFVWMAGTGHTITDNRLTNVKTPYNGSIAGSTWLRNGPNDGPAW